MFSTLLETKRRKQRNFASTFMSAVMHVLLVTGAVYALAKSDVPKAVQDDTATYTEIIPKVDPPTLKQPDRPADVVPRAKGFQVPQIFIDIPVVVPKIDLTDRATNVDDWNPNGGVRGGFHDGDSTVKTVRADSNYFVVDVDKVARLLFGPEPNYPSILKQTRQTGSVRVQFVIDTAGKAVMSTMKILETTNALFSDEVKRVLPKYNFAPAEIGNKKVRLEVVLPFEFKLDPKGGG